VGTRHGHDHGGHYHGEPYRELNDRPYPDHVILYPGDTEHGLFQGSLQTEDYEYWQTQLSSMEGVRDLEFVTPEDIKVDTGITCHSYPADEPEKFLRGEWQEYPSVLLIPGRLRIDPGAWNDLTRNDVTVNWIAVDPDPSRSDRAGAKILSDWVLKVGSDFPPSRTAGSLPGILHLKQNHLDNFTIELSRTGSLFDSLNNLLNDQSFKLRPGFLRERSWEFRGR